MFAGEAIAFKEKSYLMDAYWETEQANPLGYPLFVAIIKRFLFWSDAPWLNRAPSLIGACLIICWGWFSRKEYKEKENKNFLIWSVLLISSPMLIAYSTSATSDILPIGLLLMSIVSIRRFIISHKAFFLVSGAILFGLSCIVRYISPFFFGFFIFSFMSQRDIKLSKKILDLAQFSVVSGAILIFEIVLKYKVFGVFISTRLSENGPNFLDFENWIINFLRYSAIAGLFCGAIPLLELLENKVEKLKLKPNALLILAALLTSFWISQQKLEGEMNFGLGFPFGDTVIWVITAFGLINAFLFFKILVTQIKRQGELAQSLSFGFVPYLILISASRPTQRYSIYLIPFLFFILVNNFHASLRKNVSIFLTSFVFVMVSFYGMSFLRAQGDATERMALWIEDNNLISDTSSGVMWPHAGHHFWRLSTGGRYEIIEVSPTAESQIKGLILHREPMKVIGRVTRVYLLLDSTPSP